MSQDENNGTAGLEDMLNSAADDLAEAPTVNKPPVPTPATQTRPGNEIFQSDKIEQVTQQQMTKQEFGYEIPVDAVPLPSAGKVYPPNHPLHHAQAVEYKGMTAKEEDILMSQALIKKGTVITELVKSCLIDKRINVNSLLSGDRNALMVAIRISGYGRDYDPVFVCPECNHKNTMHVDLADLNIKPLELEPSVPGENIFAFECPRSKAKVEFKFLTGDEEERILKNTQSKQKRGFQNNNIVTTRLMSSLVSVNGDTSQGMISKFVVNMPAMDSKELRKYIDKHEPGVDMEVEFTCESCDYFDMIQLPFGSNFFWPDS